MTTDDPGTSSAILQLFQQWLTRVEGKIDSVTARLESKADRADVVALQERLDARVSELHGRIDLESTRTDRIEKDTELHARRVSERTQWRHWVIPVVITAIGAASAVVAVFVHH